MRGVSYARAMLSLRHAVERLNGSPVRFGIVHVVEDLRVARWNFDHGIRVRHEQAAQADPVIPAQDVVEPVRGDEQGVSSDAVVGGDDNAAGTGIKGFDHRGDEARP